MAELVRKIEEEDLPKVEELLEKVFGDSHYVDIARLGGMMNHSYRVTRPDGDEYLVRIPGEGTDELINRHEEGISTRLACQLGIDSSLLYMDDSGYKVMKFISNPQKMSNEVMKRESVIQQAASIFSRLHHSGVDTGVLFDVLEKAQLYEKVISENHVDFYEDYDEMKKIVMELYQKIKDTSFENVPCHNDCLVDNWVLDENDRLYLIDWEFSGMNDAIWDLSCLSIEAEYSEKEDDELLSEYFQRSATPDERKHFIAEKIFIDYLWTLWGLTRVPFDGEFMQEYSDGRYGRLKENIKKYQKIK